MPRGKPKKGPFGFTKRQRKALAEVSERGDVILLGGINYVGRNVAEKMRGKSFPVTKFERQAGYFKGRLRRTDLIPRPKGWLKKHRRKK